MLIASATVRCSNEQENLSDVNSEVPEVKKASKKSKAAVPDELYDELFAVLEKKTKVSLRHAYSKNVRKIYDLVQQPGFSTDTVYDVVYDEKRKRIVAESVVNSDAYVIVPKVSEKRAVVKHFYQAYKGEGARKLTERINKCYSGISTLFIQDWLNNNEEHCRRQPLFTNKPPLQPVIAHTVQGTHQIDLVSMEAFAVTRNYREYTHVLSVLDIFSRYLWLRGMAGKHSSEVVKHLTDIYR